LVRLEEHFPATASLDKSNLCRWKEEQPGLEQ
jgi:hypothetical protein